MTSTPFFPAPPRDHNPMRANTADPAEACPQDLHSDQAYLEDLATFIEHSPSSFHAAEFTAHRLASNFKRLDETEAFPSEPGQYLVVRDGAVIAWSIPEDLGVDTSTPPAFRIFGAHTDSPTFKLKPNPSSTTLGWQQAGVEVYGGALVNSWLDRDLCFAGRLVTRDGAVHPVHTQAFARIPQLAIHLDRAVNEGLSLDKQRHLHPIFAAGATGKDADILQVLAAEAGVKASDVVGTDIVLADNQPPARIGVNRDFFVAPRLDNLASVHAGLVAMNDIGEDDAAGSSTHQNVIPVLAAFDHEEIGSATRSGAAGPFLEDILHRIRAAIGIPAEQAPQMFADSWLLSADCGHLVHPNYSERHDPNNHPQPNAGVLLKINANQRYATDGVGAAAFARWSAAAGVPYQQFVSNNTMPCGSTIGPISATRLGIRTVDVGIGLLSMHSVREMCGAQDPRRLAATARAFFSGV